MNHQLIRRTVHFWVVFLALLTLLPTVAAAEDLVGIFFDEDYQNLTLAVPEANTVVTGYLVLLEPNSGAGVAGWELCAGIEGPGMFLSWELAGQTINVQTAPCFQVGVGDAPLPGGAQVLLATFTMLVQEPLPITFTIEPIYHPSIPDQMAYLTADDPGEIRAMLPVTGDREVAWINQNAPGAVVEPSQVYFEEVPVGYTVTRNVTVHNPGGGPLILDVRLEGSGSFYLSDISGPRTVYPGETLTIPVNFHPLDVQQYQGTLTLGNPLAPSVMLQGYGREPVVSWEVDSELVFEMIPVGSTLIRALHLSNTGEMPLPVEPTLPGDCSAFQIVAPEPFTLQPGIEMDLLIAFTPEYEGPVSCELSLGSIINSVALSGTGHVLTEDYFLNPDHLDFPEMAAGMTATMTMILSNSGESPHNLDIHLAEPSTTFEIINGAGVRILEAGASMYITVTFTPPAIGAFNGEVAFGVDLIPNAPLFGVGVENNESCLVTPPNLDFEIMDPGSFSTKYFTVRNLGNVNLTLNPEVHCADTSITPTEATLPPGHSVSFAVSHIAVVQGAWECLITLGDDSCSDVTCTGYVTTPPGPDENLVGLFFDDYYIENDIEFPDVGTVTAHLVLFNPTDPDGISGWECRLEIVGAQCLLMGSELTGEAINVGVSPEFLVGLGTPLPWAETIQLADFNFLLIQPNTEAYLNLLPLQNPSIPGEMAFLSADNMDIIPMRSITGNSQVASINAGGMVAVHAPAPEVQMQGSQVRLNWSVEDDTGSTYLVYRRGETGTPERLFNEPVSASHGQMTYLDNPSGFAPGTVLHYSYAVLHGSTEVARSPETDIVINGMPVAMTRLLPNAPNPFNPMTEINFEMEKPGMVRVSIYDVSGKLIKNLVSQQLTSGHHTRTWQGRDSSGRQVPSGAYYLRMDAGGKVDHRKIMLLK